MVCPHCHRDLHVGHVPLAPPMRVSVVDLDMPWRSMVSLMVRWALASIPALAILAAVFLTVQIMLTMLASILGLR